MVTGLGPDLKDYCKALYMLSLSPSLLGAEESQINKNCQQWY